MRSYIENAIKETLVGLFCVGLFCSGLFLAASALAVGPVEDGSPYQKFYDAVKKNPAMSVQEQKKLIKQHIEPAEMAKSREAYFEGAKAANQESARLEKDAAKKMSKPGLASTSSVPKYTPTTSYSAPREEVVIDGANVPKEIDFPGKKK